MSVLPTINAVLNSASTLFLVSGYVLIRRGKRRAHRACMISAFGTSTLFLLCYLYYHWTVGSVKFMGQGTVRMVYFAILGTHTILAVFVPFLAIAALLFASRNQFDRHRKIARIAFPVWLYVSVTGVIIYLMLYHLFAA